MPVSRNRKGHAKKAAYHKQMIKAQSNKKQRMYEQFMKEIEKYNASMTDMLNKEDRDKLPGGPEQTLGKAEFPLTPNEAYQVIEVPERDPNEPIVINEPFHIVGTPEEEAEQKRVLESAVTTSYSEPITQIELSDFVKSIDPAIQPDSYCK
jgi:hypothetical protein